jgi:NAD(P)H-hydrate epimerase
MEVLRDKDIKLLYRPPKDSHKGQNGRLLVIGGSKLFHSSIFWTADVASQIVDLVHFSSPIMENNDLFRKKAKERFYSGIVVPWDKVNDYVKEDDCVVIGPGMPRKEGLEKGERQTREIVNGLLRKFPDKKWVVDGGALQEVDPALLGSSCIITPHFGELKRLIGNVGHEFGTFFPQTGRSNSGFLNNFKYTDKQMKRLSDFISEVSKKLKSTTILLKGLKDLVCQGDKCVIIEGGNEGMTKGGTGDVLAGLVGALYCKNDAWLTARAASLINKTAGSRLYKKVGVYFNASDLVKEVPRVMKELAEG